MFFLLEGCDSKNPTTRKRHSDDDDDDDDDDDVLIHEGHVGD